MNPFDYIRPDSVAEAVAAASALGAAFVATAAGYAFAKFHFRGRNTLFAAILGAIMIPQTALVVPIYLLLARANFASSGASSSASSRRLSSLCSFSPS